MLQDLRYSLRAMAKRPWFGVAIILVLGLAVGVNTAVFSLINAFLLSPLRVRAPDELAFVYHSNDRVGGVTYSAFLELQQRVDAFSGLAARSGDTGRLRRGDDVVPLYGEAVSANYFDVLGVAPKIGRAFSANDESPASTPVALISEALWKSQFAADAAIAGKLLRIDTASLYAGRYTRWKDYTIVGVMPASFAGTGNPWQSARYWVLLTQRAVDYQALRERDTLANRAVVPIGRLKPGVPLAQARASVEAAGRDILQRSPYPTKPGDAFQLLSTRRVRPPFSGAYVMDIPRITATLAAVGTMLLIIAGTNLAGMLLARGVGRRAEIAIRLSLGVGRMRLMRQLMMESVSLAIGGGCVGLLAARVLVAAALHGLPSELPGSSDVAAAVEVPVDL
ncbi:MAG TPA: ABC transporter permease, partial [Vicinamibacterales bacterium]|nr:ABC transporter permease [Vicinamibacterales bacterium]